MSQSTALVRHPPNNIDRDGSAREWCSSARDASGRVWNEEAGEERKLATVTTSDVGC